MELPYRHSSPGWNSSGRGARARIVSSLGRTGGAEALAALVPLARERSNVLQLRAIRSLGETRLPEARRALGELRQEETDLAVRRALQRAEEECGGGGGP